MTDNDETGGLAGLASDEPEVSTEGTGEELVIPADPTLLTDREQAQIAAVVSAVDEVVGVAAGMEVRNAAEAEAAGEFLSRIASERKAAEKARVTLVKPLNDHVKMINDQFKQRTGPLSEADSIVRQKVLGYRREQEAKAAAEQARLDAERAEREKAAEEERRAAEARAQAEREAAVREAQQREAASRKAEAERVAAEERAKSGIASAMKFLSDEALKAESDATGETANPLRIEAAKGELARRGAERAAARAAAEAEAAAEREREAREAEQRARETPPEEVVRTEVAAPGAVRAPSGTVGASKVWQAEVVDETKVPRQYLAVNMKAINQAVRDGERSIPGVKIEQVDRLSVRAKS